MTDKIKHDGGQAFPSDPDLYGASYKLMAQGMTLRDWFAGQALKWAGHGEFFNQHPDSAAERAYRMADAMIKEREK